MTETASPESVDAFFTTLDLPDQSVEFRKQATASFGALRLYPITAFRWSLQPRGSQQAEITTEARLRGCGQLAALVREAPERVTPIGWDLSDPEPAARACVALLSDWFPRTTAEIVHVDGGVHAMGA